MMQIMRDKKIMEQKVIISKNPHPPQTGIVQLRHYEKNEQVVRTFKSLGICWIAALISILIPILHFILVPGLFLGGVFVAIFIYQQDKIVLGGTGTCPQCKAVFKIEKGTEKWPLDDVCSECQSHVVIEQAGPVTTTPE